MLAALGEAAIRGLLLAAAVQCALWLLHVRRAQFQLAAWTIVLFAAVAMPVLPHFTPLRLPVEPLVPQPLILGAAGLMQQTLLPELPGGPVDAILLPNSAVSWPLAIYLLVSGGLLLRVMVGVGLSIRLLLRAKPVRPGPGGPGWALGRRVRISRDITGPVTIAHVVVLPSDVAGWSIETRQAVLNHEAAHVARWDFALLVVSQLHRALFWFSPLPWWLHRRLVCLTELASDDQAMAASCDRLRYAEVLLEMARRAGPVSQGPAMARPATLSHRIDRILMDQVPRHPAGRVRQASLAFGVAGLALAAAGLMSAPVPSVLTVAAGWDVPDGSATREVDLGGVQQGVTARHEDVQEAAPEPLARADVRTVPAVAAPRPVPPRANGRVLRASLSATVPAPQRAVAVGRARPSDSAGVSAANPPGMALRQADGVGDARGVVSAAIAPAMNPSDDVARLAPPHHAGSGAPGSASPVEFAGIMGSVCTGTVTVGLAASSSSDKRPLVVAGQLIPARAEFFSKTNGTPWVRFNAFGEPPLDLPVRFTRNGMTWTGNYGIAYTVQALGGDRLAGLAALIRSDSARVDLGCSKSTRHVL